MVNRLSHKYNEVKTVCEAIIPSGFTSCPKKPADFLAAFPLNPSPTMKMLRTSWLSATVGIGVLCTGAWVLSKMSPEQRPTTENRARKQAQLSQPPHRPMLLSSVALTSPERAIFETFEPSAKEAVAAFLADTPGPLDNYLLKLEGMVDIANARYGSPDQENWRHALPIAKVLEEGMCDCAQRNWLNQFIALGEAGLTGDLTAYHQQGETMASIGRRNDDPVVSR